MLYRFESMTGHLIHERSTWEGPEPLPGDYVTLTTVRSVRAGKLVARDSPRFRVMRRHFIVADATNGAPAQHQLLFELTPE